MSAMTLEQAEKEMNVLKAQLETLINEFHQRTGLPVDIFVNQFEITTFGNAKPHYAYQANVRMELAAVSA